MANMSNSVMVEQMKQAQLVDTGGQTLDPELQSEAWRLGNSDGVSQALGGLANIQGGQATLDAIAKASKAEGVSVDDLTAMAIIESSGRADVGTNQFGYTGLMQMGGAAAQDVGMTLDSVTGVENVDNNALAGAKYWNKNAQWLDEDIPRDPLHMYLAHQQGAGGTNTLMRNLSTNPDAAASSNQVNNLPGHVSEALDGPATQQDFYDYWQGKMGAIQGAIQDDKAAADDPPPLSSGGGATSAASRRRSSPGLVK
ncbi:MAG: transglycosylase SLT domain-containing protein [Rhodobacterales bacterium]|nr:transglycosylase SLT domain-containing protein [Rhodobacterales bacterium]